MRRTTLKFIIVSLCVILLALIAIIFIMFFQKNNTDENEQARQDICVTLDALLGQTEVEEIYLSGIFFSGNSHRIISDNETGELISERTKYKIEEINLDDNKGEVKLSISFPDVYNILLEMTEENHSFVDTDELLQCLSDRLTTTYPTVENTIVCSLSYNNGHWYINPYKELFNSLSGNLYGYYVNLGSNTVNNILGEDSHDE